MLTSLQNTVLLAIEKLQPCASRDIASETGLPMHKVTAIANNLRRRELVHLHPTGDAHRYHFCTRHPGGKKDSEVHIILRADSGYTSDEKHRINVDQWTRIQTILNEH